MTSPTGERGSGDATGAYVDSLPTASPSSPPPQQTLDWVEAELADTVVEVEELVGGLSSAVHRLTLANQPAVVLRRFTVAEWMEHEPNIPHDEARNLTLLGRLNVGVVTPVLIAADPDGDSCDVPSIVMTEVAGRPVIAPDDPVKWSEQLAECLVGIHQQSPVSGLPAYRRWDDPARPVPTWTHEPDLWRRGKELVRGDLPAHPDSFLHRDFHPNNIHWSKGEICAVVDWLGACNGPIAGDLAHCRWNLAILFDPDLADHFTDHYRSLAAYSEDVRLFDVTTVLSGPVGPFPTHAWNALGRADLTSATVALRVDAWLRRLLG